MDKIIKKYWSEFKKETKIMFKEFFNKETNKKQRANMWTFSRLIISFLIPICSILSISLAIPNLLIGSVIVTGIGGITDYFDGKSARKYNSFSEYGKVLDQIVDKIFSFMIGINLALFNPLFIFSLLGEILIAAINISYKSKYNDIDIKSTIIGKIKQFPLFLSFVLGFTAIFFPNLIPVVNISIILTNIFQLTTTVSYIKNNNNYVKQLKNNNSTTNIEINSLEESNNKEKVKTINNEFSNKKESCSRKDELLKLRASLTEEYFSKNVEKNNYQKTIKK